MGVLLLEGLGAVARGELEHGELERGELARGELERGFACGNTPLDKLDAIALFSAASVAAGSAPFTLRVFLERVVLLMGCLAGGWWCELPGPPGADPFTRSICRSAAFGGAAGEQGSCEISICLSRVKADALLAAKLLVALRTQR